MHSIRIAFESQMKGKTILQTNRLSLREFKIGDEDFILTLVNSSKFIEFIGDKNIKSREEAKHYIENHLLSYQTDGFGLWHVSLKGTETSIGMCGLVNRKTLENIDIGFAFLPAYERQGYGFEAASATLTYAKETLGLDKVVAIVSPGNSASIGLLKKLGLVFEKEILQEDGNTVWLFSPMNDKT